MIKVTDPTPNPSPWRGGERLRVDRWRYTIKQGKKFGLTIFKA